MECYPGRAPSDFTIRAGTSVRGIGGQVVSVSQVFMNPFYNPAKVDFDVAVLKLATNLELSTSVTTITLGNVSPNPGDLAFVSGWGTTKVCFYSTGLL